MARPPVVGMLAGMLPLLLAATLSAVEPDPPPNIVLILADDMGQCDLGRGGAPEARTPHLDALAAASACVTRFRVAPVCAPSRAMLLTGRHHLRTGVSGVHGGQDYIDSGEELLPTILARRGYATGMWGKWHNGITDGYLPWQRGFDEALMLNLYRHRDPGGSLNGVEQRFPGRWADDVIVDHAIAFIERNRQRPFFAYLPSMTPHTPLDAPAERVARFEALGCRPQVAMLRAQMELFDEAVGRLLAALDRLELTQDTIVLFLSDNGPACNEGSFDDADRAQREPGTLRGWKGDIWENGVRSPLFVRWPRRLTPGQRDGDAWMFDLLPTLCAWAGAVPAGRPLDGTDLGAFLGGGLPPERTSFSWVQPAFPPVPERTAEQREALDEYRLVEPAAMPAAQQVSAAYAGAWKLLRRPQVGYGDDSTWLVDLARDPGERVNRLPDEPEIAQRLEVSLNAWWSGIQHEPAAFRMPTFRLDAGRGGTVRAGAPSWLAAGLKNQGMWLLGWDATDQEARWSTEVTTGGAVQVALVWKGKPPAGARFALTAAGATVTGAVGADGGVVWDAPLMLDAGPGTLSLRVLTAAAPASLVALRFAPFAPPLR